MSDDLLPLTIRLKPDERRALDRWRRDQEDPPSRAGAVCQLLRRALHETVTTNGCAAA